VHRSGYLLLITMVLGLLSAAPDSVCQQRQSERQALPTLTKANDAHSLTSDQAARSYPVHLRGVVTYYDPYIDPRNPTVWVSDSSGGIYVVLSAVPAVPFKAGDLVELTGTSSTGGYAPVVKDGEARVIGKSSLPSPARITFGQMLTGAEDGRWVEVEGVVHAIRESGKNINLDLALTDGTVFATTVKEVGVDYNSLLDAKVRLRGNQAPLFNHQGGMTGTYLVFPDRAQVTVIEPPPAHPFTLPISPVSGLLRFSPKAAWDHRVHIRGVVTLAWPGRLLCLQDGPQGLCAQTDQTTPLHPGEQADVIGFPIMGPFTPALTRATYEAAGFQSPVPAVAVTADQALQGSHDAELVEVTGQLVGQDETASDPNIVLSSQDLIFAAVLPPHSGARLPAWKKGTTLKLVGICSMKGGPDRAGIPWDGFSIPESFRILLRSPQDVVVIKTPSWWTSSHAISMFGLAVALILVTAAIRDITKRRESEARYRGLLEAAPDAMVVVNQDGAIVLLNTQAEKQFGYSRDELVGQRVTNIIPEGFAERLIADGTRSPAQALAQQIGTGIELNGRRKDGSGFPIEIMLSPLESAEGILVTAAVRDITERRAQEESLRQTDETLRLMVHGVKDYAILMLDPQGRIATWNEGAERIKGYRAEEIVGQHFSRFYPAEDVRSDKPAQELKIALEQGRFEEEGWRVRKDGSRFLANVIISPLRDASGQLRGFSKVTRDITERRAAEEHMVQMEARYRGLLESAPDAMVVVNPQGEIVLLNVQAEKHFGYSRDELVGQQVRSIIPEGFAERLIADGTRTAAEALAQQIGTGIELAGRRKDGSEFPIEIMLSPLESAGETLITATIRDISVRKEAEANLVQKVEELNRSNADLDQFASFASHDLQEPLRMVSSYTKLLAKRYKGKLDSDADEFIGFAVDGINRMQRLIEDLLLYSRVGTGGADLLDASSEEALRQALKNLHGSIDESGALVTHDPLPIVQADQRQLTQLFQNLVGNAIKYQSPGIPRVHISATRNDKKWMFSVKDNGLGIEPQNFEKIFVMFKRLHKREEFAGTGIGLAICKKIVERHGGRISVESQPGHGSTFHFALGEGVREA
jgi:PAS domain S-box-containing protein